jgi:hypothetical protein
MVCISLKTRRFEISSLKSRRRQAADSCPYCGCNSLWAKSYAAWNWPENAPCSFCRGEAANVDDRHTQKRTNEC